MKFRKKPVIIDAVLWTGKNIREVYTFMYGPPLRDSARAIESWMDFEVDQWEEDWHIKTLEDGPNGEAKHVASVGDWIIRGVQGEFYACKPDIFEATYERVEAIHSR